MEEKTKMKNSIKSAIGFVFSNALLQYGLLGWKEIQPGDAYVKETPAPGINDNRLVFEDFFPSWRYDPEAIRLQETLGAMEAERPSLRLNNAICIDGIVFAFLKNNDYKVGVDFLTNQAKYKSEKKVQFEKNYNLE